MAAGKTQMKVSEVCVHVLGQGGVEVRIVAGKVKKLEYPLKDFRLYIDHGEPLKNFEH